MSFTSQNYGVGKLKRMDKVLVNCMILTVGVSFSLGFGAWFFGSGLLRIYTSEADVIACGLEILAFTTVPYFLCGIMGLFPGALRNGLFCCTHDSFRDRNGWNEDYLDLPGISGSQIP